MPSCSSPPTGSPSIDFSPLNQPTNPSPTSNPYLFHTPPPLSLYHYLTPLPHLNPFLLKLPVKPQFLKTQFPLPFPLQLINIPWLPTQSLAYLNIKSFPPPYPLHPPLPHPNQPLTNSLLLTLARNKLWLMKLRPWCIITLVLWSPFLQTRR